MVYKFYWFLPAFEDIYSARGPYSKLDESIPSSSEVSGKRHD